MIFINRVNALLSELVNSLLPTVRLFTSLITACYYELMYGQLQNLSQSDLH